MIRRKNKRGGGLVFASSVCTAYRQKLKNKNKKRQQLQYLD